ncbi:MAG: hypothetical protein H7Y28_13325 [Rhodoferax sp.]|nr:hypothetical protein [Rhodoferax sp.]
MQPATAQNKAVMTKANAEFYKQAAGLSASLSDLSKRITTASPNDRDMLKLVVNQLGVINAAAEGILDLGALTTELRDAGDIAIVKRRLVARCASFRSSTEATAKYIESVAANIAAVATAAEANKTRELLVQMGQSPVCGPVGK